MNTYTDIRMVWYTDTGVHVLEHGNYIEIPHSQGQLILQRRNDSGEWEDWNETRRQGTRGL